MNRIFHIKSREEWELEHGRCGLRRRSAEWRSVPGYEGLYEVSSDGQIFCNRLQRERALVAHSDGYPTVRLSRDRRSRRVLIHRVVCEAFNGPPNALHREVAHLNGDRTDNRPENLKWVSPAENDSHKDRHGTRQAGDKHPRAKLTAEQVEEIRGSTASGTRLAEAFGVNESAIRKIRSGERWSFTVSGLRPAPAIARKSA